MVNLYSCKNDDVVKTSPSDGSTRIQRIRRSKNCLWWIYICVKMKMSLRHHGQMDQPEHQESGEVRIELQSWWLCWTKFWTQCSSFYIMMLQVWSNGHIWGGFAAESSLQCRSWKQEWNYSGVNNLDCEYFCFTIFVILSILACSKIEVIF